MSINRPHYYQAGNSKVALTLHGTGADERDLIPLATSLMPGATIISPRGLVLENGMNRFFERYPDGSFNEDSIKFAVSELAEFLSEASEEYGFSLADITAIGFSNGANTAAALLLEQPDFLRRAVLFGSTKPFVRISKTPDLTGKSVFLANGDFDSYAPLEKSIQWVSELESFGAEVEFLRHGGGHQISRDHVLEIANALLQ